MRALQTTSISERDRDDATNHRTREIKQQREQISVGVLEFHADDVEVRLAETKTTTRSPLKSALNL